MSYTDPDPDTDPDQDSAQIPSAGCTDTTSEQRPENARAATRHVATERSGRVRWRDRAAFDADVATLPIPGMFASPRQARKFGYRLIDARRAELADGPIGKLPLATFDDWVAALQESIEKKGIVTSEAICRLAMADCIVDRSQRDRTWDAAADRDRRREPR